MQILNNLAPDRLVAEGLPYAAGPRHRLDVYAPDGGGPFPVVVFLYGGGWTEGNRAMYRFVGGALAAHGFVTIIPDYRLYPEVRFPGFLEDCAQAVAWAHAHAAQWQGDAATFFLMGHSAGAYNTAMLAIDKAWLAQVGLDRAMLRGAIGISGPYDFKPDTPTLWDIFGPPDTLARTMPITYVDGHEPPMLLLTGTADTTVRPGNTERLAARIRETGGAVQTRFYPGIDHVEIIGAVGTPLRFLAPTLRDCVDFMRPA